MFTSICIFDAYGTLFKVASDSSTIKKILGNKSETIQELWRQKQLEYTWLRSLMGTWINFDLVTENALDFALLSNQETRTNVKDLLLDIYRSPNLFDDVLPFVDQLAEKNKTLAIASNGTKESLMTSLNKTGLGLVINDIISADDVQIFKPSPSYYQMILQHFSCLPEEVTFFSSNAWDIAGASSFGFKTVWVNRRNTVFENLGVQPDLVVNSLQEVL